MNYKCFCSTHLHTEAQFSKLFKCSFCEWCRPQVDCLCILSLVPSISLHTLAYWCSKFFKQKKLRSFTNNAIAKLIVSVLLSLYSLHVSLCINHRLVEWMLTFLKVAQVESSQRCFSFEWSLLPRAGSSTSLHCGGRNGTGPVDTEYGVTEFSSM